MKIKDTFLFFVFVTQSVLADFTCDVSISDYYAVYELNSYTCNVGQYLPANTLGCVSCPNGFMCPGGTFDFNPDIFQGLEIGSVPNNTMNNVCAGNFPIDLYAVYEPNTVTLNFDDDNGNTSTTTCTYDGLINLPEPPTRVGYDFNAWILQTNNH
jgi:hypothetical protein